MCLKIDSRTARLKETTTLVRDPKYRDDVISILNAQIRQKTADSGIIS